MRCQLTQWTAASSGWVNQRQRDGDLRANTQRAVQLHLALVRVDQHLGDRQTQARAALVSSAGFVGAIEPVEDTRQMLGCDARSRIGDFDLRSLALTSYAHVDLAAGRSVLHGIVDQDEQHLLQAVWIGFDSRRLRPRVYPK